MDEFERDLTESTNAIHTSRAALLDRVRALSDSDLGRTRRGGWSVREALHHVIDSEIAYARVIAHLRSLPVQIPDAAPADTGSPAAVIAALERYRQALVAALDGVDEATFYDMRSLGREQYSVLSVLENVAMHDHEHLEQIERTVSRA